MKSLAVALAFLASLACTSTTHVRPLAPGEHAVAVVAGGPLTNVPNVGQIPLPNVTLEGRHGIVEHVDVGYGLHVLPLVFGVAGAHGAVGWQLFDQPELVVPALTVNQKVFLFTNAIDARKLAPEVFALSETSLIASWGFADQLGYVGLAGDTSLLEPHVFLSPFAGLELRPGVDWLRVQLEARWLAPAVNQKFAVVDWEGPNDQGAVAFKGGLTFVFGGDP